MKMPFTSFYTGNSDTWFKFLEEIQLSGLNRAIFKYAHFTLYHLLLILVLFIFFLSCFFFSCTIFSCPCVTLCFNGLFCPISNVVPVVNTNELTLTLRKQQLVCVYITSACFTSKGHMWLQHILCLSLIGLHLHIFLSKNRRPC